MNDFEALNILKEGGFVITQGGVITHPARRLCVGRECEAIDELCDEWDYEYEGADVG